MVLRSSLLREARSQISNFRPQIFRSDVASKLARLHFGAWPGSVPSCARAVSFPSAGRRSYLRLARGAGRRCCGRHSHPPNPGRAKTRPLPRRRRRDAVFEGPFGRSPDRTKLAEPSSGGAVQFHLSLKQWLHVQPLSLLRAQGLTRLIHPIVVCAFGEQESAPSSTASPPFS